MAIEIPDEVLDALEGIPLWDAVGDMALEALDIGATPTVIGHSLGMVFDALVDVEAWIPQLPDVVTDWIERYDGPAAAALTDATIQWLRTPARRERRRERRAAIRERISSWWSRIVERED